MNLFSNNKKFYWIDMVLENRNQSLKKNPSSLPLFLFFPMFLGPNPQTEWTPPPVLHSRDLPCATWRATTSPLLTGKAGAIRVTEQLITWRDLPTKYPPWATILLLADTWKKELLCLNLPCFFEDLDDRWDYFFREVQCKLAYGFVWVSMGLESWICETL